MIAKIVYVFLALINAHADFSNAAGQKTPHRFLNSQSTHFSSLKLVAKFQSMISVT